MKKNHSFIALCPKYALNLKLPLVMRISLALLYAFVEHSHSLQEVVKRLQKVVPD